MKKRKPHWSARLVEMRACDEAVVWAKTQPSLTQAWRKCDRGDWMIWLLRACGQQDRMHLIAADIAESVLHLVQKKNRAVCQEAIAAARSGDPERMRIAAYAAAYAADAAACHRKRGEITDIVRRYFPQFPRRLK